MSYWIEISLHLAQHEFGLIEANLNDAIILQCHSLYHQKASIDALRNGIYSGELVVLSEMPSIPLLLHDFTGEDYYILNPQAEGLYNQGISEWILGRANTVYMPVNAGGWNNKPTTSHQFYDEVVPYVPQQEYTRYEYSVEFSCPKSTLEKNNFTGLNFFLKRYDSKKNIKLEFSGESNNISMYTATFYQDIYSDFIMHYEGMYTKLSVKSIEWNLQGSNRVDNSYIVLMPTVEFCGELGFPSKGYYYHFEGNELIQEYKISGRCNWLFYRTKSSGTQLFDFECGAYQRAIMVFGVRKGYIVENQYLVYLENKITTEKLNSLQVSEEDCLDWLNDNGVYIDVESIWSNITSGVLSEGPPTSSTQMDEQSVEIEPEIINAPLKYINNSGDNIIPNSNSLFSINRSAYIDQHIPLINIKRYYTQVDNVAYIVNAILPSKDIGNIPAVAKKMLEGLDKKYVKEKVYLIFGVNSKYERDSKKNKNYKIGGRLKRELENAIEATREEVAKISRHIYIETMVYSAKDFPYGTMRNVLLYSHSTRSAVRKCIKKNLFPYISIQDFDTGSRYVAEDEHIFKYLDRVVLGVDEFGDSIRPLMIAGGYRPVMGAYPGGFVDAIKADMEVRNGYAKLDPMLPYAPEPNLFLDASLVLQNRTKVYKYGDDRKFGFVKFSDDRGEYMGLSSCLAKQNMIELEKHYTPLFNSAVDDDNAMDIGEGSRYKSVYLESTKDEIRGKIEADSQTNRHPVRGISFYLDFNMTVETDLTRLAKDYKVNKNNGNVTMPQQHNLSMMLGLVFVGKDNKSGSEWSALQEEFNYDEKIKNIEEYNELTGVMVDEDDSAEYYEGSHKEVSEEDYEDYEDYEHMEVNSEQMQIDREKEDEERKAKMAALDLSLKQFIEENKTRLIGSPAATSDTLVPFRKVLSDMFSTNGVFSTSSYNVSRSNLQSLAYQIIITPKINAKNR